MNTDWTITDRLACCAEELLADTVWLDTPDAERLHTALECIAAEPSRYAPYVAECVGTTLHSRVWAFAQDSVARLARATLIALE